MNPPENGSIIPETGSTKPRRTKPRRRALKVTAPLVAGAGASLVLLGSISTPTLGSTRSARLIWEARQEQTERELATDSPSDTAAPAPDPTTTRADRDE